ncbi:MAG: hypothetical protein HYR63_03555 [Proteobacteria bacterium]|nr:hypothetical protein [Pseudomonadota bacterium]MBI3500028.1 hypothetical protein [Pseudomonadota bacterium]
MLGRFLSHPRSVGQSYSEHLLFAQRYGWKMVKGGLAAILHGLMPFLFVTTASETVRELSQLASVPARKPKQRPTPRRRNR